VNAISGERCNPHPHVFLRSRFSGRAILSTTTFWHSYMDTAPATTLLHRGLRFAPMVDAYKRCRDYLDAPLSWCARDARRRDCRRLAQGARFRFRQRRGCFCAAICHGIGLPFGEASDQPPGFIRHRSTIEPGMVFALETFWPRLTAGALRALKKKS